MGWFTLKDPAFWFLTAGITVGYVIVWLIMYLKYKQSVKRINEALKVRR